MRSISSGILSLMVLPLLLPVTSGAVDIPVHILEYHNEAYNVWENLRLEKGVAGAVLIHIDAHDDLGTDSLKPRPADRKEAGERQYWEGSFIHPAVKHGLVTEIWNVSPDEFPLAYFWFDRNITLYCIDYKVADNDTFFYFTSRKPELSDELRSKVTMLPVKLHNCHLKDLPDFSREPRAIYLDFDSDYFANEGTETWFDEKQRVIHHIKKLMNAKTDITAVREKVGREIESAVELLKTKQVHPAAVTIARSPDYTIVNFLPFIPDRLKSEIQRRLTAR